MGLIPQIITEIRNKTLTFSAPYRESQKTEEQRRLFDRWVDSSLRMEQNPFLLEAEVLTGQSA